MISWRLVTFEPLDVVINADARGLGDGSYAHEGDIFPQAFAGLLRTAILANKGFQFRGQVPSELREVAEAVGYEPEDAQAMRFRFAGPLLWGEGDTLLFPLPKIYRAPSLAFTLEPAESSQALFDDAMEGCRMLAWVSLYPDQEPEPGGAIAEGFLDAFALSDWLLGENREPLLFPPEKLYSRERRWGHRRAPTGVPQAGGLFSRGSLRFVHKPMHRRLGPCFAGLLGGIGDDLLPDGSFPARLAGEGRLVQVEVRDANSALQPLLSEQFTQAVLQRILDSKSMVIYLATPALFRNGWRPSQFEQRYPFLELLGAAVGHPAIVAGWDRKKNAPKAPRRAVPAGSVYFFRLKNGTSTEQVLEVIQSDHGNTISEWDSALGFGLAFFGAGRGRIEGQTGR
jgi:CRISPR type III-B/RAMP module-associated protein Cmr3